MMEETTRVVVEEPITNLDGYADVSIGYVSDTFLEPRALPATGWELTEHESAPYSRDFDLDENPTEWAAQFDLSNWALLRAMNGTQRVGGAVLAYDTPGVNMLED